MKCWVQVDPSPMHLSVNATTTTHDCSYCLVNDKLRAYQVLNF